MRVWLLVLNLKRLNLNFISEIAANKKKELIWLVEHPPLYTGGASANEKDLLDKESFPVYHTRRGGKFTYHGPGQRVAYVMLDLNKRGRDVRSFVEFLERWIITTLLVQLQAYQL